MPKDSNNDNETLRVSQPALQFRNELDSLSRKALPQLVFRSNEEWDDSKTPSLTESPMAESIATQARTRLDEPRSTLMKQL